jgi:methionine aminotransferase
VGVATIPVSSFYHNRKDDHVIRFCFSKQNKTLQEAAMRLKNI